MVRTQARSAQIKGVDLAGSDDVTGALPIANGGTGQTTAQSAINALSQVSGASVKQVLYKTAGGDVGWIDVGTLVNSVLDVARTVDTVITISDLFGGSINLGTGGSITLRYNRIGRIIDGCIFIKVGTSPTLGTGVWAITHTELPAAPYNWGVGTGAEVGGFGAISGNANLELAAMVFADVGGGAAYGVFFCPPGDGTLGNLLSFNTPIPIKAGHTIQSNIHYEAAAAA